MSTMYTRSYKIYLLPFLVFRGKGIQIQDLILLIGKGTKFFSLFCKIKFHYLQLGTFPAKDSEVFYNPKWKISHHHNKRFKTKGKRWMYFQQNTFYSQNVLYFE